MTLIIQHSSTYIPERRYIYDVFLCEFLGLGYQTEVQERLDVRITRQDDPFGKELFLRDTFFQTPESEWLTSASLPKRPLLLWDVSDSPIDATLVSPKVPVTYGDTLSSGSFCEVSQANITLGLDIFGSAFFMLTRYEEIVKPTRDRRERFPGKASFAYREGFLTRPIVNEYLEILWWALQYLWSGMQRKQRVFQLYLSHDVDRPFCMAGRRLDQVLKSTVVDVVMRKNPLLVTHYIRSFARVQRRNLHEDIYNTFDFIINLNKQHDLKSAFYFMTNQGGGTIDGSYSMEDPWIRKLMRQIHECGHEIGLHPSYNTFRDPVQTRQEFEILLRVCEEEGMRQLAWGGRQHYLRWENPTTWQNWEEAGLDYDSTLGFVDQVGFRCGVCYEYPVFNLKTRQCLRLRERPLVVMEVALLYGMGFPFEAALEEIIELKRRCKLFQGEFTLLWHNSSLVSRREKDLYQQVIREVTTN